MEKIAFFGATGMLAQPVIQTLAQSGYQVTALVRDTTKAKKNLPANIKLVEGDLNNPKAIEDALEGVDFIYLNLSVKPNSRKTDFQSEREGLQNILKIAKGKGVKCIAYLSSLVQRYQGMDNFNWWAFEIKNQAVEKLKTSNIPYLIFYPSTFMENFDKGSYRQGKRINLAGKSVYPMYFIAGEDYAKQVVNALSNFNGTSKEYIIQGTEALNADEAAKLFVSNYTKEKMSIAKLPYSILAFLGKLTTTFNYGANIVKALNNYPEKFEAQKTWEELGKPSLTLKEYAKTRK
jgi:uncharacterized protein YbjT (DUF2867 family)